MILLTPINMMLFNASFLFIAIIAIGYGIWSLIKWIYFSAAQKNRVIYTRDSDVRLAYSLTIISVIFVLSAGIDFSNPVNVLFVVVFLIIGVFLLLIICLEPYTFYNIDQKSFVVAAARFFIDQEIKAQVTPATGSNPLIQKLEFPDLQVSLRVVVKEGMVRIFLGTHARSILRPYLKSFASYIVVQLPPLPPPHQYSFRSAIYVSAFLIFIGSITLIIAMNLPAIIAIFINM